MTYVEANLMPEERILHTAKVHWYVFIPGAVLPGHGVFGSCGPRLWSTGLPLPVSAFPFYVAAFFLVRAQLIRTTTELAVTSRRVIAKFGVIRHHSIELSISKVESFEVVQGILGRILGFGTINVNGTGGVRMSIKRIDKAGLNFVETPWRRYMRRSQATQ